MRRYLPAALILSLSLPATARADWGWTRWGMDVDQVIETSKPKVKPVQGQLGQRVNDWDLLARGKTRQDGLKLTAEFFFDPEGKALHLVKLTPRLKDCPALLKALTARYGAPTDQGFTIPSSQPIVIKLLNWRDTGRGDFIGYSENPQIGDLPPGCFVRYRPIAEADPPAA